MWSGNAASDRTDIAMTETTLRAAIVGTGAIARMHAEALASATGTTLVAVADAIPERAAAFAGEHGVEHVYASLTELLAAAPVDVVHICTPPGLHAEQVVEAFAAGAHVVVEKPPARSLAEFDTMIAAAAAADRELAVVFQQRTGTAAAHVRSLLSSGALGRPLVAVCNTLWYRGPEYFDMAWRGTWETEGGGTTLSHGIHQIDLLAHLLGDWAVVSGHLWRLDRDIETEDVSMASLQFASGAVAAVVTSVLSPRETSSIRIDTERATVTVDHLYGHGHADWSITPAPGVGDEEARSWAFPVEEIGSGHDDLLAQVYGALASGAPLPAVADAPVRSFEIVAAIYASAASGTPITPQSLRADPARVASLESPVTDLRPPGA